MKKMNPVIHFELTTEDSKRMSDFYVKAFGWETKQVGSNMGNYVVVTTTQIGKDSLPKQPGAIGLDDLHVWALSTTTSAALSCHLVIQDYTLKESLAVKENVKQMLSEKFHIEHATIETGLTVSPHRNERTDKGM